MKDLIDRKVDKADLRELSYSTTSKKEYETLVNKTEIMRK